MGLNGPFKMDSGAAFPHGCGVVSAVTPSNDFDRSTRENPVQARDKESGRLLWQVDVMDFDPDARERTFKVKIIADYQPVPPDAIPGTPVRPVELENLQITPWLQEGKYTKIAYSAKCTGLNTPARKASAADSKAA